MKIEEIERASTSSSKEEKAKRYFCVHVQMQLIQTEQWCSFGGGSVQTDFVIQVSKCKARLRKRHQHMHGCLRY